MQDSLLRANRAIAMSDAINDRIDLESNGSAMTASEVARHLSGSNVEIDWRGVRGESRRIWNSASLSLSFEQHMTKDAGCILACMAFLSWPYVMIFIPV